MTYFTLQITYLCPSTEQLNKTCIEERKDLCAPDNTPEIEWKRTLQQRLYTFGFQVQTAPGTWEFISPFRVITAFLITQDKKYGL